MNTDSIELGDSWECIEDPYSLILPELSSEYFLPIKFEDYESPSHENGGRVPTFRIESDPQTRFTHPQSCSDVNAPEESNREVEALIEELRVVCPVENLVEELVDESLGTISPKVEDIKEAEDTKLDMRFHSDVSIDSGDCLKPLVKKSLNDQVPSLIWNPHEEKFMKEIHMIVDGKYYSIFNELIQNSALRAKYPFFSIKSKNVTPLVENFVNDCMDIVGENTSSFDTTEKEWCKILFDKVRENNPKWIILLRINRKYSECVPDFSIEVMT
jgi:hypothetical protein